MSDLRTYVEGFLDCIAPGCSDDHTFQAFHDRDKAAPASPILHGSFAQHQATLEGYAARGYGVFFAVNGTDGRGRGLANMSSVRCVWLDIDDAGRDTTPIEAALPPHCVVESSPGKHHLYWRVADCPSDAFDALLDALTTRWAGDHGAKGINRVLRLPGFAHQKAEAFVSRIVRWQPDLPAYSVDTLRASLLGGAMSAPQTPSPPVEWTTSAEPGWTNTRGDAELLQHLRDENAPPKASQVFGDDRTTAWLVNADPDALPAGDDRSKLRMSLLTRIMFKAGGDCEQVRRVSEQIPLCVKDDRDALLQAEIVKARANVPCVVAAGESAA